MISARRARISRARSRRWSRSTRRRRPVSASPSRGACRTSGATSRPSGSGSSPTTSEAQSAALLDARRFPSDPEDTELEQNDVAVLLRSDSLDAIAAAEKALFDDLGVLTKTTIRRGFAGGGLPSKLAVAAGVPGADLIPPEAELFLGFTSTLRENLGPSRIANLETLGLARIPEGYFTHGTHMHLSHIHENLEAWYVNSSHDDRVHTTFRPGLEVPEGTLTVPQGRAEVSTAADVRRSYRVHGSIGHSGALQTASRLERRRVGPDGTVYPAGIAIPQRADFNTLDNPFAWSADGSSSPIRRPASTSSSSTRRATTSTACATRWTACCPTGRRCRSSRGPRGRASTASSARPGGRTSSSRRAPIARSRCPSSGLAAAVGG